jgi:hypothetical protein
MTKLIVAFRKFANEPKNPQQIIRLNIPDFGLGNVVGIATAYRLDGPRIESRWGRDYLHLSRPAHPPVKWVPGLSRW